MTQSTHRLRVSPGLWIGATLLVLWLGLGALTAQGLYLRLADTTLLVILAGVSAWHLAHLLTEPGSDHLHRVLAGAALCWCLVVWVGLALSVGGALTRTGQHVAWIVLALTAVLVRRRWGPRPSDPEPCAPVGLGWPGWVLVTASLAALAPLVTSTLFIPPTNWDSMSYHLYLPARWIQAGRVFTVPTPFGPEFLAYFPFNAEMLWCWLMLPLEGDLLVRVGQVPLLLLAVAGVYGLGRQIGAAPRHACLGAVMASWTFLGKVQSATSNNDVATAAAFVLAVYFVLAYARCRTVRGALWAGLGLGLFLGTKVSSLVFLPLVVLPMLVWAVRQACPWSRRLAHLAVYAIAAVAAGGFWYVHNWVLTGNPLFPAHVSVLGWDVFWGPIRSAGLEAGGWSTATHHWSALVGVIGYVTGGPQLVVLVAGWLAAMILWAARDRRANPFYLLLVLPAMLALFWFGIAYQSQGRYCLPGIFVGYVAVSYTASRLGRWGWTVTLVVALAWVCAAFGWPNKPSWKTLPQVAIPPAPLVATWSAVVAAGVLGAASLIMGLCTAFRPDTPTWRTWTWRAAWLIVLVATGFTLAVGRFAHAVGPDGFAPNLTFGHARLGKPWQTDLAEAWRLVYRADALPLSIAYTGHNIPYYLLGPGYIHRVRYVNINPHRAWLLHDYCRDFRRRG